MFTADVTWEVTMPAITTIREDSVLRESMDILEYDEKQFEFSNKLNARRAGDDVQFVSCWASTLHRFDQSGLASEVNI
ncbi:hypothetical protein DVH05_015138 [Phytophthora capsici]|nr:hypothetical protein DVH05_015138 [Phytophthora capsici]